jgi:hypothetical protein
MQLSEHFALEEFERTSRSLPNKAPAEVIPVLTEFCERILEPTRAHFGRPVVITSGCRSPLLNHLIGGAIQSYHVATVDHCAADPAPGGPPGPKRESQVCGPVQSGAGRASGGQPQPQAVAGQCSPVRASAERGGNLRSSYLLSRSRIDLCAPAA